MNITLWKVDVTAACADWWDSISVRQCHFFLLFGQLHPARFAYNTHPSNLRSDLKCFAHFAIRWFYQSTWLYTVQITKWQFCKLSWYWKSRRLCVVTGGHFAKVGRRRDQAVGGALASNWRLVPAKTRLSVVYQLKLRSPDWKVE